MKITVGSVDLASPMEALFYGLCAFHEIPADKVMLHADEKTRYYWPAFHVVVPGFLDLYAEISSDEENGKLMRPLRTSWRSGHLAERLAVLYREDLDKLRDARTPSQFVARLSLLSSGRL